MKHFSVDGGWGTWSSWTKCNAKCPKANGKEMRTRECDNPVPKNGGKACVGDEKEEKDCKITCAGRIRLLCVLIIILH